MHHLISCSLRLSGDCSEGGKAYYAYVAEGVSKQQDWEEVMKYQQRNGSLFSSPSTTASAVIHTRAEKALSYLRSLLQKFGNSGASHVLIVQDSLSFLESDVSIYMQFLLYISLGYIYPPSQC